MIIFSGCSRVDNSSSNTKKSTSDIITQNKYDETTIEKRNYYAVKQYEILRNKKLKTDSYGNLCLLNGVPYFAVVDEMLLDLYLSQMVDEIDIYDYKYTSNFRNASDNKDFLISDYKNGVCVNAYSGDEKDLVIPTTLDGKKVIKIGGNILQEEFDTFIVSPFYGLELNSVTIPKTVKEISYGAFTTSLNSTEKTYKYIYVDSDNPYYTSIDGILYSKDKKCLLQVPTNYPKTDIEIPEGTLAVYSLGTYTTKSVKIPASVISIGETINKSGNCDFYYNEGEYEINPYQDIPFYLPVEFTQYNPDWQPFVKFTVSEDNKYYSDKNYTLYNKEQTLVVVPSGEN
jgi:hypothetical protein